ncbi:Type II secretion system protein G [Ferriphaselus amnicola]|uniref:Type II secretion system protein G n=1 Tax=Ferriphaselus amnicola TaxID=1188319 RepID=A0A2Z6G9I7_9PROT|nr:type II secretion system protein [Ferriphaselus amnicola]BBE50009.1 Type II secretion system protein G [Ferriphaselus amnicola]
MQMQRKQQGFTLIELVAVIVVLGILASVALPKFFGIQGEARAAAVNAAKANLAGSANMAHAKMLVTNTMPSTFDGVGPIQWSAHNPTGESAGLIAGLNTVSGTPGMMSISASFTGVPSADWEYIAPGATFGKAGTVGGVTTATVTLVSTGDVAGGNGNEHAWVPRSAAGAQGTGALSYNASGCYVKYTDATLSGTMGGTQVVNGPFVTAVTSGCSATGM